MVHRHATTCGFALLATVLAWWPLGAGAEVYDAAFFKRFAPQTARDMLGQVPGFSVRDTSAGRGLGQGGANVLINGDRVTSKGATVTDILDQTPAAAVMRIEVTDAASLGVTGLAGQVANVVLDRSRWTGAVEWRPSFRRDVKPRLTATRASLAGRLGNADLAFGIDSSATRSQAAGPEERLSADGTLLDLRQEESTFYFEEPVLTALMKYPFGPATSLTLTSSGSVFRTESREISAGLFDTRIANDITKGWTADFAAELTRELGQGALKLIGSQSNAHFPTEETSLTSALNEPTQTSRFFLDQDEGESIGRVEYGWSPKPGATWEVSAETAFNFLEAEGERSSSDGLTTENELVPNVRVEELRHQASVTHGFLLGRKLNLQTSVSGEWSGISVVGGGAEREDTFLRPRGFLSFSYPAARRLDIRGRVERAVGQLSFGQFVDGVDLAEEFDTAGNTSLVPQQSWLAELEFETRVTNDEKIIVRIIGEQIEDLIVRGLIDGRDALVNTDEASRLRLETEGTILLDRWSVPGGRVDFSYIRRATQLNDPITLESRPFNNARDWRYSADFRQDVFATPYAWGFRLQGRDDTSSVRFDEVRTISDSKPDYRVFFEHKDLLGLNVRFIASNLGRREFDLQRVRFAELRETSPVDTIERRTRRETRRFQLNLSKTF